MFDINTGHLVSRMRVGEQRPCDGGMTRSIGRPPIRGHWCKPRSARSGRWPWRPAGGGVFAMSRTISSSRHWGRSGPRSEPSTLRGLGLTARTLQPGVQTRCHDSAGSQVPERMAIGQATRDRWIAPIALTTRVATDVEFFVSFLE